jgi:LysR family hydrogen peroxide-inducible transcriptional activator
MSITIKQLKYLCAVAEYKHFTKAAEASFVTQSTLSAAINELEVQLDVKVFERNKRSLLVTPLGEKLLVQARIILGEVEDLLSLAKDFKDPLSSELRLGVIPTVGPFLLPPLLSDLRSQFSKLKLYLKEEMSARLLTQLQDGSLDLIILALPFDLPNMEVVTLMSDDFCVCLPPDHRLKDAETICQDELRGESLLLLEEGHCLRDHALDACNLEISNSHVVYEGNSLHTLVQMVANNLGITLLPAMAVDAKIIGDTGLRLKPFSSSSVNRKIGMAWRQTDPRRDEYIVLAEFIRKRCIA